MIKLNRKTKRRRRARPRDENTYPSGWSHRKVQRVLKHYENQTDEEAIAEDEGAYCDPSFTMMQIPKGLVPRVQKLISKRAG